MKKVFILFEKMYNFKSLITVHSTIESAREGLKVSKRAAIGKVKGIVKDEDDCYEYVIGSGIHGDDTVELLIETHNIVEPPVVYRGGDPREPYIGSGSQHDMFGR